MDEAIRGIGNVFLDKNQRLRNEKKITNLLKLIT